MMKIENYSEKEKITRKNTTIYKKKKLSHLLNSNEKFLHIFWKFSTPQKNFEFSAREMGYTLRPVLVTYFEVGI